MTYAAQLVLIHEQRSGQLLVVAELPRAAAEALMADLR